MPITFPLDLSGSNPTNLVTNELHSVSEGHFRDYFFIIPNFAPFFVHNFSANITIGNVTRPLVEDVDFSFCLQYVTGTRVTGKPMYGGLTLHNLNMNGIISISYQTVGGDQIADRLQVLTVLADKAYNPRVTIFDILSGVPNAFPPSPHYQDYENFYGQEEVVTGLNEIRDAILTNSSITQESIATFLNTYLGGSLGSYLRKTGDVMLGRLMLSNDPIDNLEAATKQYVDLSTISPDELNSILSNYYTIGLLNGLLANKVSKTGDVMTGQLVLSGNPLDATHASNKQYVDSVADSIRAEITNLLTAIGDINQDYVTKTYVDNRVNELMSRIDLTQMGG